VLVSVETPVGLNAGNNQSSELVLNMDVMKENGKTCVVEVGRGGGGR
jgi:hypothetical protein